MLMTLTMTVTLAAMIAICGVIPQQLVICFTPPSLTWLVYVAGVPAILGICILCLSYRSGWLPLPSWKKPLADPEISLALPTPATHNSSTNSVQESNN